MQSDQGNKLDVLLVEDNVVSVQLVSSYLANAGHVVRSAASIAQAIESISQGTPDIILLDNQLEGDRSGADFLQSDRARVCPDTPIIMLTADESPQLQRFAFRDGGVIDVLHKPIAHEHLLLAIHRSRHIIRERNARLAAQAAALAAEEARAQMEYFSRNLVHELRTPLHLLMAELGVLRDTDPVSDVLLECIGHMEQHIHRALELENAVTLLSRLQAGLAPAEPERVYVRELVHKEIDTLQRFFSPDVCFDVQVSEDVHVVCTASLLARVLYNILTNAMRYAPCGSTVRISAEMKEGEVHIWVADTGPGVPVDMRKQIFDPYVQSESDHNANGTLGIGLSICRQVVDLHGGRMWAEDNAPGARFVVALPAI